MNEIRTFKLMIDLPFLSKGTLFVFYDSTGFIHWIDDGDSRVNLISDTIRYLKEMRRLKKQKNEFKNSKV